jgi:hypothetical protein
MCACDSRVMAGCMRTRSLAALLLLALLGACAAVDASAPKLAAIKTIGIISAIGGEFTITKAGLTGLASDAQSVPIEAWGIDDLIVSRAGALLGRRFDVRPLTYRRAAFAAVDEDSAVPAVNLLREDPIKKLVPAQVSPLGLDAYVLITKAKSIYGSTGRTVTGVGIVTRTAAFGFSSQIHALYVVRLLDGHEFKVIAKCSASPLDNAEINRLAGPSHPVDDSFLPAANDIPRNEKLKAAIIDLIERSLPTTLEDLGLVDRS